MAFVTATATFTAADSAGATWETAANPPLLFGLSVTITDGGGPVNVYCANTSNSGVTVIASAPFTGRVDLIASG